jgi:hypothetical protein
MSYLSNQNSSNTAFSIVTDMVPNNFIYNSSNNKNFLNISDLKKIISKIYN